MSTEQDGYQCKLCDEKFTKEQVNKGCAANQIPIVLCTIRGGKQVPVCAVCVEAMFPEGDEDEEEEIPEAPVVVRRVIRRGRSAGQMIWLNGNVGEEGPGHTKIQSAAHVFESESAARGWLESHNFTTDIYEYAPVEEVQ